MKIRFSLLLALLIAFSTLLTVPFSARAMNEAWQPVGDGIDYQEFHLSDPLNNVYVARLDRANPNAILDSAISGGVISHGTERVSDMFKRYDDAINFWGGSWGQRNKVVVAINGSYFNAIGAPESGQISSGWYAKRFDDLGGGSGLAFKMDRKVFIGQCVKNEASKQTVKITRGTQTLKTLRIDGVNIPRGDNQLILYTPQYDDATHTNASGVEVVVEMTRPDLNLTGERTVDGFVRQILDQSGQTPIPFDAVILSASGSARDSLLANIKVNDEIGIYQEITEYNKECTGSDPNPDADWAKTYASIGGAFVILNNGEIQHNDNTGATARSPRTAMAYNDQSIFFIVVDGRSELSGGMTFDELAAFSRDVLGASWAIAQDGGGSSVMVVNGEIKNYPVSACNAVYLPLVSNTGAASGPSRQSGQLPGSPKAPPPHVAYNLYSCERPVANGMMMVNVLPAQRSVTFSPFDMIVAHGPAEVRLGPGTNYAAIATLPSGAKGIIIPHFEKVNGIQAKGSHWWKVAFGDITGWVSEDSLLYMAAIPTNLPYLPN